MRILVIEDDHQVARTLKLLLSSHNYATDVAIDGTAGLQMIEAFHYDLIVLDVLLPKLDGLSLCQQLRTQGYQMPVLLLTGQNGKHETAIGLNTGADDYVVKPFDAEELIARIQALLRRGHTVAHPVLAWSNLRLDPISHNAYYGSATLCLTPKEYAILELFLRNRDRILKSATILDQVWACEDVPGEETVRVHIKGLRKKLKAVGAPADFIETVYRVGYRLKPATAINEIPPITTRSRTETPPGAPPNPVPPKVLLVTSDASLSAALTGCLKSQTLTTIVVSDLTIAKTTLATDSYRLLLLDIESFNVASIPFCQALRQQFDDQSLSIVALIPCLDATLVKQLFAAGANDFISKPIAVQELIARIASRLL
ncbi:MAG TPA: response regulator [Microcoleaceae cyanobacterium]|jgi:DNA-binding response OmpR family regulator